MDLHIFFASLLSKEQQACEMDLAEKKWIDKQRMKWTHSRSRGSGVNVAIIHPNLTSGRKGMIRAVIKMESLSVRDTEYNSEMFQKTLITRLL